MPLIEPPVPLDRNPHQIHLIQRQPQRADRSFEHRRIRLVEGEALLFENFAGPAGLADSRFSQIHIGPTGKSVFQIPLTLTVPQ